MKPKRPHRFRSQLNQRGFALVISLSLMVLLTVLAVGLLTLSSVSLRASGAGEARAEAQANARMALMLAIGELQTTMGPDQSISARASVINRSASEPNMLGTWGSWHWQPGTAGPTYSNKAGQFRGWLVSTPNPESAAKLDLASSSLADPVWLVNPDTVGSPSGSNEVGPRLRAERVPMEISETRLGAFAWGIMDESQKAPIQLEDIQPKTDGERLARRVAPVRAQPERILESLSPESLDEPEKIISLDSAVVAVGKEKGQKILSYQGDVTPYSQGLLSNVVDGGLKTDLTTVFESSSMSPNINGKSTPYLNYRDSDGAPTWAYLRSHYQLNRKVESTSSGQPIYKIKPNSTDVTIQANGLRPAPLTERVLPVIAKMQIMFSIVTHPILNVDNRVNFYDTEGIPKGAQNYAVPNLVYDPVVTLYNPYDVAIDITQIRIRIWDPPVLFGFKKNADWLRDDFKSGTFHSLARFTWENEDKPESRRFFTLFLRDLKNSPNAAPPGGSKNILLQPGEVRVYSPWVQNKWTWGLEVAGGYNPLCFFDWNAGLQFGNRDVRTGNKFGVESVPGWDPRAGLQTDHLSFGKGGRPSATKYSFETAKNYGGGWVTIKKSDNFTVAAKPGRAVQDPTKPDFQVDILAGKNFQILENTADDMLRTYRFRLSSPLNEISENKAKPVIERTQNVGDLMQGPTDPDAGGKTPFAVFSMTAKTTKSPLDYSMPWLHNHPVVEGSEQNSSRVGNALDSYDLRLEDVTGFDEIEIEGGTNRGYYGATPYSQGGVTNVPMFRLPLIPATSLGDLIPANLVSSSHLPRATHPLGNSRAHPLIPANAATRKAPKDSTGVTTRLEYDMLDHSYMLNEALWDRTYFSTVANFSNAMVSGANRQTLLKEFLLGDRKLLNPRFVPAVTSEGPEELARTLDALDDSAFSKRVSSALAIQGPFNVNSDSVGAWKAVLTSLRNAELKGWGMKNLSPKDKTGFSRFGLPIAGDADEETTGSIDLDGQLRWAGFRALNDDQIDTLAKEIVEQIRLRGSEDTAPSLTLGEFVNRRIGNAGSRHVLAGLLQTAIDKSRINEEFHKQDSKDLTGTVPTAGALTNIANPDARIGKSAEGAPALLTQGDLLMALAPIITVRGDTFRVRAYGESRTKDGAVQAKAWCEAIVQRIPEYLDPSESPELKTADLKPNGANARFGRRFVISSFRWLSPEEV